MGLKSVFRKRHVVKLRGGDITILCLPIQGLCNLSRASGLPQTLLRVALRPMTLMAMEKDILVLNLFCEKNLYVIKVIW